MKLDKMSFDDLLDHFARRIHSGLLERGGTGLRSEIRISLMVYDLWLKAHKQKKKTSKKAKK